MFGAAAPHHGVLDAPAVLYAGRAEGCGSRGAQERVQNLCCSFGRCSSAVGVIWKPKNDRHWKQSLCCCVTCFSADFTCSEREFSAVACLIYRCGPSGKILARRIYSSSTAFSLQTAFESV